MWQLQVRPPTSHHYLGAEYKKTSSTATRLLFFDALLNPHAAIVLAMTPEDERTELQRQLTPPPLLTSLPWDVIHHVLSFVHQPGLLNCRLLNHELNSIATLHAFRHVWFGAIDDQPGRFLNISRSSKLRPLVRELTCDTWIGYDFEYGASDSYEIPEKFMQYLPCLRFFPNLKTLNLRFNEICGCNNSDDIYENEIEETVDFRYRVLDTVFKCLAGSWTAQSQYETDESLDLDIDIAPDTYETLDDTVVSSQIPIETLTVSNLGDYADLRLTDSPAFRKVVESGSLIDLKLAITVQMSTAAPETAIHNPEQYEMFATLPQTWLAPTLAQNLRVLSLYSIDYWGWCPKFDLRTVNPLAGSNSGFPSLRKLALGNYIFSHEWQIDWIASLGKNNGRGGLEELYLSDCPIMQSANYEPPLDESTVSLGNDVSGQAVIISNKGYPVEGAFTKPVLGPRVVEMTNYNMRWHDILPKWERNMTALKVFKMGGNSTDPDDITHAAEEEELYTAYGKEYPEQSHRLTGNAFRWFDLPSPPLEHCEELPLDPPLDKPTCAYLFGAGLEQCKESTLQYIQFDVGVGPSAWLGFGRRSYRRSKVGDEARPLDEEALKNLHDSIRRRLFRGR